MIVPVELILFIVGIGLVLIGLINTKVSIFKLMGSILLIVLTVVILKDGISGINNLATIAIASVSFGIGVINLITHGFQKEDEQKRLTYFEDDGRFHG